MSSIICPSCAAPLEDLTGRADTSPGAVALCVHCRALGIFNDQRVLRVPTEAELDHLLKKPVVTNAISAVAEFHRRYGAPKAVRRES